MSDLGKQTDFLHKILNKLTSKRWELFIINNKLFYRLPIHNSFRNKNSRIEIWVFIITSFHLLLESTYLKFYVKNLSASLDQTLKIVDPVEDFLPYTINK